MAIDESQRSLILAYCLAEAGPDRAAECERLLGESEEARRWADVVRQVLGTLEDSGSSAAPREAIDRAVELIGRSRVGLLELLSGWIDQIAATLVFDSLRSPAIAGLRGHGDSRHLSFESPRGEIDLQMFRQDEDWSIRGQFDSEEQVHVDGVVVVEREDGTSDSREQAIDPYGMFAFVASPGRYHLTLDLGDAVINLPAILLE